MINFDQNANYVIFYKHGYRINFFSLIISIMMFSNKVTLGDGRQAPVNYGDGLI